MANVLTAYKNVTNIKQDIIEGTLFNGIVQNLVFASGETVKYLLLEIPLDITCQFVGQGLTLLPYDETFQIRLIENITTLTTGTPIIIRNLNRNVTDVPLCKWTVNPVGTYGNEGIILEDFNPYLRQADYPSASKTIEQGVERIFEHDKDYLFKFSRATDTNTLQIEFRFLWIES